MKRFVKKVLWFVYCVFAEYRFEKNFPEAKGYFKNGKECGFIGNVIGRFNYTFFD